MFYAKVNALKATQSGVEGRLLLELLHPEGIIDFKIEAKFLILFLVIPSKYLELSCYESIIECKKLTIFWEKKIPGYPVGILIGTYWVGIMGEKTT